MPIELLTYDASALTCGCGLDRANSPVCEAVLRLRERVVAAFGAASRRPHADAVQLTGRGCIRYRRDQSGSRSWPQPAGRRLRWRGCRASRFETTGR
jgi:hypothetical protein